MTPLPRGWPKISYSSKTCKGCSKKYVEKNGRGSIKSLSSVDIIGECFLKSTLRISQAEGWMWIKSRLRRKRLESAKMKSLLFDHASNVDCFKSVRNSADSIKRMVDNLKSAYEPLAEILQLMCANPALFFLQP